MKNNNYIGNVAADCMLIVHAWFSWLVKGLFLLFILFTLPLSPIRAAGLYTGEEEITPFVYDEIPVHVIVEGYNNFYVDAIYTNNKLLYINIEELFKTINIPCIVGSKGKSISGFIENESQAYLVDYDTKQIKMGAVTINTRNGLVKEMGALYMESSLFNQAFGLLLNFNYRTLTITLKSSFELPVIKQQRIEKMRTNMSKLKREEIADTVLHRNYHMFRFGTIDWLLGSSHTFKGLTDNHFGIGVGTELLYGEADILLNYYNQQKIDNRQLQYIWRWVDNNNPIIRQAQVGKISAQPISFINAPVIGAVIRNSPTTVRKASGYYTINDFTEPNWTVELYINNELVDFTRADASGSYVFKVPIVYGYTTLKLRFYGPLGEERTEERTMNVPYTVMPANEFEYSLTAGIVQDSSLSRFGKAEFNYGVNRMLTVGGGLEFLSSIPNVPYIPYAKATLQPLSKLTLNGEYAYGVRSRGLLNYYFSKDVLLEIDYTKYVKGQLATRFNAPEERKVKLSVPVRYKKISGFLKFDYTQLVYTEFIYNQGNMMFSAYYRQISANSTVQLNWIDQKTPFVTTNLVLSYRLENGITIRPSAQFNVSESKLMTYKTEIEKRISKGLFSFSYERNVAYNDNFINVNFKYDLPFARTSASVSHSKGKVTTSESAQGSLAFGGGNNYTHVSNNSSVSKGGILLYPFLDLNHNGIFDKGEHMVYLNKIKISGGKAIFSEKDSIIRIPDLNAFTSYLLEFSDNELETIAWRFRNKRYQVLVDPNQFKRVDIPIIAVGEATGMAYRDDNNSLKGIGRILVKFYKKNGNKIVAEALSELDGYIYYLGLEPGDYLARIDSVQLSNLGYRADPPQIAFTIKKLKEGDMVGGIDFVLRPVKEDKIQSQNNKVEPVPGSDLDADSIAGLEVNLVKVNVERSVPQEFETIVYLTDEISLPLKPSPVDLMVERAAITKSILSVGNLNEEDTMQLTLNPVQQSEDNEVKTPEMQKITYLKDKLSLPPNPNPVELMVERAVITKSILCVANLNEEDTIPLKSNPVDALAGENLKSDIIGDVVHESDTISHAVKPNVVNLLKTKETITTDSVKIFLPATMHRIDQKATVNKVSKDFIPGDTLFKVQLLALPKPLKDKNYFTKLMADVPGIIIEETLGEDGLYHYSTQAVSGIAESKEVQKAIRKSGWKDSFIAIYAGEKRADLMFRVKHLKSGIQHASKIPSKMPLAVEPKNDLPGNKKDIPKEELVNYARIVTVDPNQGINKAERVLAVKDTLVNIQGDSLYKVQLLALHTQIKISNYFALLLSRMPGLQISEIYGEDNLYHYSAGSFRTAQEAGAYNVKIRNCGWVDSFIISQFMPGRKN